MCASVGSRRRTLRVGTGIYGRFGYGMASLFTAMWLPRDGQQLVALGGKARFGSSKRRRRSRSFPESDELLRSITGVHAEHPRLVELRRLRYDPDNRPSGGRGRELSAPRDFGRNDGYALFRHAETEEPGDWKLRLRSSRRSGSTTSLLGSSATPPRHRLGPRDPDRLLPIDHPLLFLASRIGRRRMRVGDGFWARLVDVGSALSAASMPGTAGDVRSHGRVLPLERRSWRLSTAPLAGHRAPDLRWT